MGSNKKQLLKLNTISYLHDMHGIFKHLSDISVPRLIELVESNNYEHMTEDKASALFEEMKEMRKSIKLLKKSIDIL